MSIALATKGIIAGFGGGGDGAPGEDILVFAVALGIDVPAVAVAVDTPPGVAVSIDAPAPIEVSVSTGQPSIAVDAGGETINVDIVCTEG